MYCLDLLTSWHSYLENFVDFVYGLDNVVNHKIDKLRINQFVIIVTIIYTV